MIYSTIRLRARSLIITPKIQEGEMPMKIFETILKAVSVLITAALAIFKAIGLFGKLAGAKI